jgi:hypothetical protein
MYGVSAHDGAKLVGYARAISDGAFNAYVSTDEAPLASGAARRWEGARSIQRLRSGAIPSFKKEAAHDPRPDPGLRWSLRRARARSLRRQSRSPRRRATRVFLLHRAPTPKMQATGKKKLVLNKTTLKNLKVRSGIKAGNVQTLTISRACNDAC